MQFDRLMKEDQRFIEPTPNKPQIFYIWGHSYEKDYENDYWQRLEDFFKLTSNRDDIFTEQTKRFFSKVYQKGLSDMLNPFLILLKKNYIKFYFFFKFLLFLRDA